MAEHEDGTRAGKGEAIKMGADVGRQDNDRWSQWTRLETELDRHQWSDWIRGRCDRTRKTYATDPTRLIADARDEREESAGYRGREILELIQNADDSGVLTGEAVAVDIRVTDSGVIVANTGSHFSPGGLNSVVIKGSSPKVSRYSKFIGSKGRGFRSVLNWSASPFILSGDLSVAFSEDWARQRVEELSTEVDAVHALVDDEEAKTGRLPMPVFSFPVDLNDASSKSISKPELVDRSMWQRCLSLHRDGKQTVIGLPFPSRETLEQVVSQVEQLTDEVLIFLNHVSRLSLSTPSKRSERTVDRVGGRIGIVHNGLSRAWDLRSEEGSIPLDRLPPSTQPDVRYEIKVALPKEPGEPMPLFSFLPTGVDFPFTAICHATFELTSNRQEIVDSNANRFISDRLADFLVRIAEEQFDSTTPWQSIDFLGPYRAVGAALRNLGFVDRVLESARAAKIVPTLSRQAVTSPSARTLGGKVEDWLPYTFFKEVVPDPADWNRSRICSDLEIPQLQPLELLERLNSSSSTLSIDNRATLIAGLIAAGVMPHDPPPSLLIDDHDQIIPPGSNVFLPPEAGVPSSLPAWADAHVLHPDLVRSLTAVAGWTSHEALRTKLSEVWNNVRDFSSSDMIHALAARAVARAVESADARKVWREVAVACLGLFNDCRPDSACFSGDSFQLLSADGQLRESRHLYFGGGYSSGAVICPLLKHVDRGLLVADTEALALPGDLNGIEDFLAWLGVAKVPRVTRVTDVPDGFRSLIETRLRFPLQSSDDEVIAADRKSSFSLTSIMVTSVENLQEILAKAAPDAILAWAATDPRIEDWRRKGDVSAIINARKPGLKRDRRIIKQRVPSLVWWTLSTVPWLPTSGEVKRGPEQCVLASSIPEEVRELFPTPLVDSASKLLAAVGLDQRDLQLALERIGVAKGLESLTWDRFYQILLDLPAWDPSGRRARTAYRLLLARPDEGDSPRGAVRDEFLRSGMMYGIQDGVAGYFQVNALRYQDSANLPAVLTAGLPLLALDKRRGASKVARVFGVKPVDASAKVSIKRVVLDLRQPDFANEIDQLKPFVYALYVDRDASQRHLRAVRGISFSLVTALEGEADRDGTLSSFELKDPEDLVVVDRDAYVVAPENLGSPLLGDEVLADITADVFGTVLGMESNGPIAQLASCDPDRREALLRRLLGESCTDLLTQAREKLGIEPVEMPWLIAPGLSTSPAQRPTEPAQAQPSGPIGDTAGPPASGTPSNPPPSGSSIRDVQVRRVPIVLLPAPRRRKLVVRPSGKPTERGRISTSAVDSDRCEELVYAFERDESQGRHPVRVGHLQGDQGVGCDIVSFGCEEDAESFKAALNQGLIQVDRVVRFIEVKGRSAEHGVVILEGNELRAAGRYKGRYYLYRVFEEKPGHYQIITLRNPLALGPPGHSLSHRIDLHRSPPAVMFSVNESASEDGLDSQAVEEGP
jgi:hypothetical protein